jgi:hypothetical protein
MYIKQLITKTEFTPEDLEEAGDHRKTRRRYKLDFVSEGSKNFIYATRQLFIEEEWVNVGYAEPIPVIVTKHFEEKK